MDTVQYINTVAFHLAPEGTYTDRNQKAGSSAARSMIRANMKVDSAGFPFCIGNFGKIKTLYTDYYPRGTNRYFGEDDHNP
jgi:hypothetical protein